MYSGQCEERQTARASAIDLRACRRVTCLARRASAQALYDRFMRTSMKMLAGALALGAVIGSAAVATAGQKKFYPVKIDVVARTAEGAMGDARRSADPSQNITVTITAMADFSIATAAFRDASGVVRSCNSTEPAIVAALAAVKSDGHVAVEWDAEGHCTVVNNYTSSSRSVKEQ
jgi:hypothetical protein